VNGAGLGARRIAVKFVSGNVKSVIAKQILSFGSLFLA